MGDGNIVNAQYKNLHTELSKLKKAIVNSNLSEPDKFNLAIDIESLNDQLAKPLPDKSIFGLLWSKIEAAATLGGFADAVYKIFHLIGPLLPSQSG